MIMKERSHAKMRRQIQRSADGRLTPSQQQALDAHLAGCTECRLYAAELRALETRLSSVSFTRLAPPKPRAVAQQVAAIQASYRRHTMKRNILSVAGALVAFTVVVVLITSLSRLVPGRTSPAVAPSAAVVIEMPTATPAAATATPLNQPLRYFTRAESDKLPLQPFQLTAIHETVTPKPETPTPDPSWTFTLSVAEAEQLAGFDVLEPIGMSKFLNFQGAAFDPQRNIVRIRYVMGFVLHEEQFQFSEDCDGCGMVGASAVVETVQIGDVTGEYVVGVWEAIGDTGQWGWIATPYLQRLRWQSNGMAFELMYNPTHDPAAVTLADLIAIAESLR
jgi:hypothetical protein